MHTLMSPVSHILGQDHFLSAILGEILSLVLGAMLFCPRVPPLTTPLKLFTTHRATCEQLNDLSYEPVGMIYLLVHVGV